MKSKAGFTLIEVIVSLILAGILALIGGMAIVQVIKGYVLTKDNAEVTQKAQLATSRITKEVVEMTGITANADASTLPLKNNIRNVTIGLDAGAIKIAQSGVALNAGDILVDNVHAFTLTYYSKDTSGNWVANTSWSTTSDIRELIAVDISFQLPRSGGGYLTFINRISPRNNKNTGGTVPTAQPPTVPNYGTGCFVATAAYGAPDHPMVLLLRDFRDRYLLTWQGGRWLVKQYYTYGPAAADLIRNRPLAMWAVRCLLAPFAALTFCLIYAPLAFPFLLLIASIFIGALFSAGRRGKITFPYVRFNHRGSILIALIGTIVVMATLGAAMLPMLSSSFMNQAYADQGRKTYFLAESGFRYAASQYLNASTLPAKETVLTNLNNKTCNLSGNGGSFTIVVYPYWSKTQSVSGTTLTTQISGTNPSSATPAKRDITAGGYLKIGSSYCQFSNDTGSSSTTVIFNGLSSCTSTVVASPSVDVLPVVLPASTTTVTNGGNLTLSSTGIGAFPILNGNFTLNGSGKVYGYEKRTGNTLYNITMVDSTQTWANFTVTSGSISAATKIVLDKYLQLSSTGTLGNNSREILYNVPIGWMNGNGDFEKKKFRDTFDSGTNWTTGSESMGTQSVSGGAMNVTATINPTGVSGILAGLLGWSGNGNWAFTAFNWSNTETNLAQSWMDAEGCLSYDIQVKVKTSNLTNPNNYFMGGLGFRMRNNTNSSDLYKYGVSIVRARQISVAGGAWVNDWIGLGDEGIANEIGDLLFVGTMEEVAGGFLTRYRYSQPAIVFWQRNGPATGIGSFKVLAYRLLTTDDAIVTGTAPALRLKPWSSLMVRLIEGYELPFTLGRVDASSRHLKYGDTISNLAGTKTARVIGTPIMTTDWGGTNTTVAAGTLILTNRPVNSTTGASNPFTSGENLYLDGGETGVVYAIAGTQAATKANYIMVYYSDDKAPVAGDVVQANNTRIGNERNGANFLADYVWPPDDWTDRASGYPPYPMGTASTPPGNDYFTLVQWHYLVPGSGLTLSVTPANGWSYSAPNLTRVDVKAPPLTAGNWTLGNGWTNPIVAGNGLQKSANGQGTAQPSTALNIINGVIYDVSVTATKPGSSSWAGSFSYTLGGSAVRTFNAPGTFTDPVTASGTGNLIFTPTNNSRFYITAVSVTPRTAANQIVTHAALTVGTTYNFSFTVTNLTTGSVSYTIGGYTSPVYSANGTYPFTFTALNTNPLTFISPIGSSFTISSMSISSADTYASTLDTTDDGYGHSASFVSALNTTDFYHAVIKTDSLVTGPWTSSSSVFSGDSIALVTSGNSVSASTPFSYDDFAIQLDQKSGTGFLPPIQQ